MKIMEKPSAPTIMTSELNCGDVVGDLFAGEMNYYIYGYDNKTGDNTFTNLSTGQIIRESKEREFYFFPDASFTPN